jgi:hypothetical protein
MVFTSNDGTNSILYATSPDGYTNWTLGPAPGQTSGAAPALAQYFVTTGKAAGFGDEWTWTITTNLLVLVFVATNLNNIIQYAMLDLSENPNYRGWRFGGSLWRNFGQAVSVSPQFFENAQAFPTETLTLGTQSLTVYFTSDDPSNSLLETSFVPV